MCFNFLKVFLFEISSDPGLQQARRLTLPGSPSAVSISNHH